MSVDPSFPCNICLQSGLDNNHHQDGVPWSGVYGYQPERGLWVTKASNGVERSSHILKRPYADSASWSIAEWNHPAGLENLQPVDRYLHPDYIKIQTRIHPVYRVQSVIYKENSGFSSIFRNSENELQDIGGNFGGPAYAPDGSFDDGTEYHEFLNDLTAFPESVQNSVGVGFEEKYLIHKGTSSGGTIEFTDYSTEDSTTPGSGIAVDPDNGGLPWAEYSNIIHLYGSAGEYRFRPAMSTKKRINLGTPENPTYQITNNGDWILAAANEHSVKWSPPASFRVIGGPFLNDDGDETYVITSVAMSAAPIIYDWSLNTSTLDIWNAAFDTSLADVDAFAQNYSQQLQFVNPEITPSDGVFFRWGVEEICKPLNLPAEETEGFELSWNSNYWRNEDDTTTYNGTIKLNESLETAFRNLCPTDLFPGKYGPVYNPVFGVRTEAEHQMKWFGITMSNVSSLSSPCPPPSGEGGEGEGNSPGQNTFTPTQQINSFNNMSKFNGWLWNERTSSLVGPFLNEDITAVSTKDNSGEMYCVTKSLEVKKTNLLDLNQAEFPNFTDPFTDLSTPIDQDTEKGLILSSTGKGFSYKNKYIKEPFKEPSKIHEDVESPLYFRDSYLSIMETNWIHLGDEHNEKQVYRVDLSFHKNSCGHLWLYVKNDQGLVKGQYKGMIKPHMKVFTNMRGRRFKIQMMIATHNDFPWAMREMSIGHLYGKSF